MISQMSVSVIPLMAHDRKVHVVMIAFQVLSGTRRYEYMRATNFKDQMQKLTKLQAGIFLPQKLCVFPETCRV